MKKILQTSTILVLLILILAACSPSTDARLYSRSLDHVLKLRFTMTAEDIIAYEADMYNHTEYLETENRLRFSPYTDTDGTQAWLHDYMLDDVGLIKTATYRDALITRSTNDSIGRCTHIRQMVSDVLSMVGDWDEEEHDGLYLRAYASLGGERCRITYQTGPDRAIHFSKITD